MASNNVNGLDQSGWLVVDPSGQPYAWYGADLAGNEEAAWRTFESDAGLRTQLVTAGWTVRPGSGVELVLGRSRVVSVRVSA